MTAHPWPWAGRSRELQAARGALAAAGGGVVLITGPSGSGRTRMAQELGGDRGGPSWIAGCLAGRAVPLGALVRWADTSVPDLPERIAGTAAALARAGRIVVADDVQVFDDASLAALTAALERPGARAVLTVRTDAPTPPAARPLLALPAITRVAIDGLGFAETREAMVRRLAGDVDAGTVGRFWRLSGGRPAYLTALVDHAHATGSLRHRFGLWTLDGDLAVPRAIADLLDVRIRDAGPEVAEVLDILTEIGRLPYASLAAMTSDDAVGAALAQQLVAVSGPGGAPADGIVEIAHPLLAEVRRHSSGIAHRRRVREQLTRELRSDDFSHRDLTLELGLASLALDDPGFRARDLTLLRGADAAVRTLDLAGALRFARAVAPGPMRVPALVIIGYVHSLLGEGDACDVALSRAIASTADPAIREVAVLLRVYNQVTTAGDPAGADAIIHAHAAALSPGARRAAGGFIAAIAGDPVTALANLAPGAGPDGEPEPEPGEMSRMYATMGAVIAAGDLGDLDTVTRAVETGDRNDDRWQLAPHQRVAVGWLEINARQVAGDVAGAQRAAAAIVERVPAMPNSAQHWLTSAIGAAALARGAFAEAVGHLHSALTGLDGSGAPEYIWYPVCLDLGLAAVASGNAAVADDVLARIDAGHGGSQPYLRPLELLLRAGRAALDDLLPEAVATAYRGAELARTRHQPVQEAACLIAAARLGDATGADRLATLAEQVPGAPRVVLGAQYARALDARDPHALIATAATHRTAGLPAVAADAEAQAAMLLRRGPRTGAALSAQERALRDAAECGLVSPALRALARQDGLTERQREIMRLATRGLTNQQIAQTLGLSVRTVEGHRYRAARSRSHA